MKQRPGRVHLERLPAYSPELNRVEFLWSQLKWSLVNQVFCNFPQLTEAIIVQLATLQACPNLGTTFFRKKEVAFFTS
ncbi:transposase [Spirosoma rhododendri]|uniref:Tc1-like transposase DDE domain-containing protein n=1 Tax=Spirosoma rhododendri TaxID=2728024 RepID=A0A7L5DYC2_9BACT|nr:hypothetical protein HH216_25050 [Spirosoma rhododendri]